MKLSLIVAQSKNHVIGKNNQLPWHLPADLKHFKNLTLGKPVIMGRKTFDSIGKPLPDRKNIIISHNKNFSAVGCDVFHSIDDALTAVKTEKEVMIIGGAHLFHQVLDRADCIYMTIVNVECEGDTFFPVLNNTWHCISEEKHEPDEKNAYPYQFLVYHRC